MKYLNFYNTEFFEPVDGLLIHGEHLPALAKLDTFIYSSNELKFQHLLIVFKINNESFSQYKFENPVKFIWDNLEGIADSFLQHETYIVSLETAIVLKARSSVEDLLTRLNDFKKSMLSLTDDKINYFESMLQYLQSMYYLRIKIDYNKAIDYLKESIKQFSRYNNEIGFIHSY